MLVAYPLLVYALIDRYPPRYLLIPLLLLLALRLRAGAFRLPRLGLVVVLLLVAIVSLSAVLGLVSERLLVLGYPVAVSAVFLAWFGSSLVRPPTVVEQVARMREPDLPPEARVYTRKVTQVWCGFFVLNGLIAAWTVWVGDLGSWAVYNGLISYLLMGLLFAAEFAVRSRVRRSDRT